MKTVSVVAHSFDCLPGHVTLTGRGQGSSLQVAVRDAIKDLFSNRQLHKKRIGEFKCSVVVISDK